MTCKLLASAFQEGPRRSSTPIGPSTRATMARVARCRCLYDRVIVRTSLETLTTYLALARLWL
jgi:hypothetical protein